MVICLDNCNVGTINIIIHVILIIINVIIIILVGCYL